MENSRVVCVTGGSRGIGAAIASRFLEQGYRVAATSRAGTAPEGVLGVQCDVTSSESVDAAFTQIENELGPVEILVANAGITHDTLLLRMSDEDFAATLNTNLSGAFRCTRRVAKPMAKARWGRLIYISSVVGFTGSPGQANYAASKAGLLGFSRSLAAELGGRGITANVVAPGFIETEMTAELPEELAQKYLERIPAKRFGTVDDIAHAVTFLASAEASYINGTLLAVDGGISMGI
ncbi:MAG: beta-ketoacyl-ACP reductase [Propionibacteriaceae bacterium]